MLCGGFAGNVAAMEFGACIHLALGRSNATTVLRHIDGLGLTTFRDDVYWNNIELVQGKLQMSPKYEQLGLAVAGMAQRSKSSLLVLDFGNKFYDNGGYPVSDEGINAFARYADFVVRHYGDSVRWYEVWNEWSSGFGSKPKVNYGDPAAYVRLLAATSKAIKQANPKATVVGGAVAGVDLKWVRDFIRADGLRHLDVLSIHSYTLFQLNTNPEVAIRGLDKLRAILQTASPDREIPVYITEMGWPTNTGKYGVSERDAAKYLARFMVLARSRPWIQGVWWYDLIDDGDNDALMEHRYGLVARNQRLKPAYLTARQITPLVLGESAVSSYRTDSGAYVVTGTDGTGPWSMTWAIEPSFLNWIDGQTTEPPAPAELAALAGNARADGFPVLLRKTDAGKWQIDPDWASLSEPQMAPPTDLRVQQN
jgi:hypothetical protein